MLVSLLNIADAVVNVFALALDNHFDRAVGQIADNARQSAAVGNIHRRESKADALDASDKNNMFCNHVH